MSPHRAMVRRRYGWNWWRLFWDYSLTRASAFLNAELGHDLRFYGFTVGEWALGFVVRRREPPPHPVGWGGEAGG